MCGSVAGCTAGIITTPLDVAKTRIILADVRKIFQDYLFPFGGNLMLCQLCVSVASGMTSINRTYKYILDIVSYLT